MWRVPEILILGAVEAWVNLSRFRLLARHRKKMGFWPRVAFPGKITEKFLWRKLFDHNPEIAKLSDKLLVKEFFNDRCPDIGVPRTLWIGETPNDIPDDLLERPVVVKTNHGSGFNVFVQNGEPERRVINGRVNHWLRNDTPYGKIDGEWAYTQISPKVFVEEMLLDTNGSEPLLHLVHVNAGRVLRSLVLFNTIYGPRHIAMFGNDDRRILTDFGALVEDSDAIPADYQPPDVHWQAVEIAKDLGAAFDAVRVDFLSIDGKLFANEMTFYSSAGYPNSRDPKLLQDFSQHWDLRNSWFLKTKQAGWRKLYAAALTSALNRRGSETYYR